MHGRRLRPAAYVLSNGAVRINDTPIAPAQLPATLKELYANRAERVLFRTAEPPASVQTVTEIIDIAATQIEVIAILPPTLALAICWTVHPPTRRQKR